MPIPERRPLGAGPVGADLAHAVGAFVVAQRRARGDRGAVLGREWRDVGDDMRRAAGGARRRQALLDKRAATENVGRHRRPLTSLPRRYWTGRVQRVRAEQLHMPLRRLMLRGLQPRLQLTLLKLELLHFQSKLL